MTTKARAVKITGKGGVEVLRLGDHEVRDPGPGEVLVAVRGSGLNRADTLQRRGFYPAPAGAPVDVPGLEYAGRVFALGEGVEGFAPGDPVMGIVAGGGMASHVVVHSRELIPVPPGMDLVDAAAVPEVFLTAYDALFRQASLAMGQVLLIHAVGSGVGTAALQLSRAVGATPVGTSRTADKLDRCKPLGLEHGILVEDKRFAQALPGLTGGRLADVILDSIGAAYVAENLQALATGGTLVILGLMGGATGEVPLGLLLNRRARIQGTVLRSRPLEEKAALAQAFAREVLPLFASGKLRPVLDDAMPVEQIGEAHERMEANQTFGKLVLTWPE